LIKWPPPNIRYEYIAVDFDGTLFENEFPEIGAPKPHVIEWVKEQQKMGSKIILHTCREWDRLENAIAACRQQGLRFDAVNENPFTEWEQTEQSKKPFADIYLDDRAWRVE
jgi:FMN phosphatase YigB (HAD superfamily)